MGILEIANTTASMAERLERAGYAPVGPMTRPHQPGDYVTLSAYVTPRDLVVQRILVGEGLTEQELQSAVSEFRRQLAANTEGDAIGVLTLVFDGRPSREIKRMVGNVPYTSGDVPGVALHVGMFNSGASRYVGFNKDPVGLIAEELADLMEGKGKAKAKLRKQAPISVTADQHEALQSLAEARQNLFVVWAILAANTVLFIIMFVSAGPAGFNDLDLLLRFGANFGPRVGAGEVWRLFTCMFIHIGTMHFLFNSYALYLFGREAEASYGGLRFLAVYICSGLAGSTASVLVNPQALSAGASGAIFGLIGALIAFALVNRDAFPKEVLTRWMKGMVGIIVINVIIGVTIEHIDNTAHMGGLAGGFLFGLALSPRLIPKAGGSLVRGLVAVPLLALLGAGIYGSYASHQDLARQLSAGEEVVEVYNDVIVNQDGPAGRLRTMQEQFPVGPDQQENLAHLDELLSLLDEHIEEVRAVEPRTEEARRLLKSYGDLLQARRDYYTVTRAAMQTAQAELTEEEESAMNRAHEKVLKAQDEFLQIRRSLAEKLDLQFTSDG